MTVIKLFSSQKYILIYQNIINIHLAYHGCKISPSRVNWPQTSGNILTTLKNCIIRRKVWVVGKRIDTYCTYLLIQDSTLNIRLPSKAPETWAG